jgi:hypothetical protein
MTVSNTNATARPDGVISSGSLNPQEVGAGTSTNHQSSSNQVKEKIRLNVSAFSSSGGGGGRRARGNSKATLVDGKADSFPRITRSNETPPTSSLKAMMAAYGSSSSSDESDAG